MTILDRFLKKVKINETTGCWEWQGARNGVGRYGIMGIAGRPFYAHRLSWLLYRGKVSGKDWICHTCDNKGCVNPDHLFPGDRKDNVHDAVTKGLYPKGEASSRARLTEAMVREVRRLYVKGIVGCTRLARRFGVGEGTIRAIVLRRTWKHVA